EQSEDHLAAGDVPDAGRLVEARRGEALAVGAEGDPVEGTRVPFERGDWLSRRVPDTHGPVVPTRRDELAIGAVAHTRHAPLVSLQCQLFLAGRRVADLDLTGLLRFPARAGDLLAVGAVRDAVNRAGTARDRPGPRAGAHVPDTDR